MSRISRLQQQQHQDKRVSARSSPATSPANERHQDFVGHDAADDSLRIDSGYQNRASVIVAPVDANSRSYRRNGNTHNGRHSGDVTVVKRSGHMNSCLISICVILLAALACVTSYAVLLKTIWNVKQSSPEICTTEACYKKALIVIDAMNTSVSPCDDFFEYACGNWHKRNPIPQNKDRWCTYIRNGHQVTDNMREILEAENSENDLKSVKKARDAYSACMNREKNDISGVGDIAKMMKEFGGWTLSQGSKKEQNVMVTMAKVAKVIGKSLLDVGVDIDLHNATNYRFYVDQGMTVTYQAYYTNSRYTNKLNIYKDYLMDVVNIIGLPRDQMKREIEDMLNFEIEFAKILATKKERADWMKRMTQTTIRELENMSKKGKVLNWRIFIDEYTSDIKSESGKKIVMNDNTRILFYSNEEFIGKLAHLLDNTDRRTVNNYLVWRVMYNMLPNLSEKTFGKIVKEYYEKMYNYRMEYNDWRDCIGTVKWSLKWPTGRMYVDKHFTADAKKKAEDMVEDIRSAMTKMLAKVPWMSIEARAAAIDKAKNIKKKVGYPDFIMNNTLLDAMYKQHDISKKNYFANVYSTWKAKRRASIAMINEKVNVESRWEIQVTTVNAWYQPDKNQIVVPAGMLQPPFYHKDYPKYSNYGGIGFLLGHELSHGFDNYGRKFDKHGNLRNWWSKETIEKYVEKTKCFIDKYNDFKLPNNLKINGKRTLNENLADTGAIRESYMAYKTYANRRESQEPLLPGKDWSIDQLFYLNVAQGWCEKIRKGVYKEDWLYDEYSPDKYRVLGVLQSSKEFASAYNCPIGSPMNPEKRCTIWQ